jgi:signal transduction histidine kinase
MKNKKILEKLKRQYKELRELDAVKTKFLSITSQEGRSPLTPMKAQVQMLLKDYFGKLNRKQKESLEVVLRNTERLDKVILELLEVSRIEANRLKINIVQTDMQEELERLRVDMMHTMMDKHVNIFLKTQKMPVFNVDSTRVMQVLRILVNNAIKFSPSHGDVAIGAVKKAKAILFSVKDTGIGIGKEKQKNIFKPFYQAEETMYRKYGGIGLGLSIAKGIVESLGGKIWFESESGKGAIFYFTIPLKPVKRARPARLLK